MDRQGVGGNPEAAGKRRMKGRERDQEGESRLHPTRHTEEGQPWRVIRRLCWGPQPLESLHHSGAQASLPSPRSLHKPEQTQSCSRIYALFLAWS